MDPIQNPYTPGAGAPPPALTGRDAELERFRFLVQRVLAGRPEKSMLVTGLRGVGKTVLLNQFEGIAEEGGFETAFKEVTEDEDFRLVLARMLRRILLSLSTEERIRDRARRALGILRGFSMRLPGGAEVSIDVDAVLGAADSGDLQADFAELFIELGEVAKEAGTGIILFFDEIQYLKSMELGALITGIHRVVQRVLPMTIVGAGLPQIPALAGEAKSYAERLFDIPEIGSLPREDAIEAIVRPAGELHVAFQEGAAVRIVELSEGYPYFLQEYGKHVWNLAASSPIRVGDVEDARIPVQEQLDENFFRVRISRSTVAEKRYLRAMAELGQGPYRSGDVAEKLGRKVTSMGPLRAQLIHKGFIYSPSHGFADFTVPKFDDFMRRTFPFPFD